MSPLWVQNVRSLCFSQQFLKGVLDNITTLKFAVNHARLHSSHESTSTTVDMARSHHHSHSARLHLNIKNVRCDMEIREHTSSNPSYAAVSTHHASRSPSGLFMQWESKSHHSTSSVMVVRFRIRSRKVRRLLRELQRDNYHTSFCIESTMVRDTQRLMKCWSCVLSCRLLTSTLSYQCSSLQSPIPLMIVESWLVVSKCK